MGAKAVGVRPVRDADVARVAGFLHTHLNPRLSAATWAASMSAPWAVDAPNHGFMLLTAENEVVGVYLAFYADRRIDGRVERFCNLAGWCVLPDYRWHAVKLL